MTDVVDKKTIANMIQAAQLVEKLQQEKNIIIEAPRQSGKTTLIKMIKALDETITIVTVSNRTVGQYSTTGVLSASDFLSKSQDNKIIFDEPWHMNDEVWKRASHSKGCILIGTPIENHKASENIKADEVLRLGYENIDLTE
jgi:hypothetical protein